MHTHSYALSLLILAVVGLAACGGGSSSGGGRPTMAISISPRTVLAGSTATATIVFSEDVTGFEAGDIAVGGGTAEAFTTVDARTYELAITAGGGGSTTVDVDVAAGVCVDMAGNAVARSASAQAAIAYAPWASATGTDAYGVWADLSVTGHGVTAVQRFRLMLPGTFLMGSVPDEEGRNADGPFEYETRHPVTLTTPFWIADSECTQRLWKAVTGEMPSHFQPPQIATADLDLPVEQVSHTAVSAFLGTLNGLAAHLAARLPTESEWEYAARAGTTTPFSLEVVSITTINCSVTSIDPYIETGSARDRTVVVKSLPPNAWGLYEVHGNVWEWCADWWQDDWGPSAVVDPLHPASGSSSTVVLRGGSWWMSGKHSRSARRYGDTPSREIDDIGFRLAAPNQPGGDG